jgi:hypothetical protein
VKALPGFLMNLTKTFGDLPTEIWIPRWKDYHGPVVIKIESIITVAEAILEYEQGRSSAGHIRRVNAPLQGTPPASLITAVNHR